MPTADQLAGLADYRKARDAYERPSRRLTRDAHGHRRALARRWTTALARGDEDAATDARRRAAGRARRRRDKARRRPRPRRPLRSPAARTQALAGGAGFDLLSSRHPLLLLPVRLETRFAWSTTPTNAASPIGPGTRRAPCWCGYSPTTSTTTRTSRSCRAARSGAEASWTRRCRRRDDLRDLDDGLGEGDPPRRPAARRLAGRGCSPAARLRAVRPGKFSRPSVARLLPDSWLAIAELDRRLDAHPRIAGPVREPLETGPAPDGIDWMIDFDAALKAGMALVRRGSPGRRGDPRLVVLGVRGTLDPGDSAAELERLLDAQHYTRGLGFVAPGTPTNSIPGVRAGYTTRPRPEDVLPIERRRFLIGMRPSPLVPSRRRLRRARRSRRRSGSMPRPSATCDRADATALQAGMDVRSLLATATRRHLTRSSSTTSSTRIRWDGSSASPSKRSAPTGHFPALRVGNQPYGLLPVLLRDDARIQPGTPAADLLPRSRPAARPCGTRRSTHVPRVGEPGREPGRDPRADPAAGRGRAPDRVPPAASAPSSATVVGGLGPLGAIRRPSARPRRRRSTLSASRLARLAAAAGAPLGFAPPLTAPLVEPPDARRPRRARRPPTSSWSPSLRPDRLLAHDYGGAERPRSLLFSIARLAMLARADAAGAGGARPTPARTRRSGTRGCAVAGPRLPGDTAQRRLEAPTRSIRARPSPSTSPRQGRDAATSGDLRQRSTAARRDRPAELLEQHLRASLGLLQPPARSLVHRRSPSSGCWSCGTTSRSMTGLAIGAYGVVEHIRGPRDEPVSGATDLFTQPIQRRVRPRAERQPRERPRPCCAPSTWPIAAAGTRQTRFSVDLSSAAGAAGPRAARGDPPGPAARGAARLPNRARNWPPRSCSASSPHCEQRRRWSRTR